MIDQTKRFGFFTNSEIWKLLTKGKEKGSLGKPAKTYIKEKNYERRLGCALSGETTAMPTSWGKLVEKVVFELLPTYYTYNSSETLIHPDFSDCWKGTPDGFHLTSEGNAVTDIKSPYTRHSFCNLVEPLYAGLNGREAMDWIRANHDSGEDYFWQLVGNAEIKGYDWAELIIYMPYASELAAIRLLAEGNPQCSWIQFALELPSIPDGGYYKNVNIIRFEISKEDKDELRAAVTEGKRHLIEWPEKK